MTEAIPSIGGCQKCGYDLRGLESRKCPECGQDFDPADRSTVGPVGFVDSPRARWAMGRVGWAAWVFTAAVAGALIWNARFPEEVRARTAFVDALWPVLYTYWGGRLLGQLITRVK